MILSRDGYWQPFIKYRYHDEFLVIAIKLIFAEKCNLLY